MYYEIDKNEKLKEKKKMGIESRYQSRNLDYPKLMEYDSCGENYVWLMTTPADGVCVKTNNPDKYSLGMISFELDKRAMRMTPFNGEIVLRNVA